MNYQAFRKRSYAGKPLVFSDEGEVSSAKPRRIPCIGKYLALVGVAIVGYSLSGGPVSGYVDSGLVGQWDGIDNAGTGTHDPSATKWKDLTGLTGDGTLDAKVKWDGNCWTNGVDCKPVTLEGTAFVNTLNTGNYTVEFTVMPVRDDRRALFMGGYNSSMWTFEHNGYSKTNACTRYYFNGNPDFYADYAKIVANETATFAVACGNGNVIVYKNGIKSAGFTNLNNPPARDKTTVFGGDNSRTYMAFLGRYYAVRLYNRQLSEAEVVANAAQDAVRFSFTPAASGVPTNGYLASNGTFYKYVEPIYFATIAEGGSNTLDEVTFRKKEHFADAESTEVSYGDFLANAKAGTLLKQGAGTLVIDQPIAQFDGNIHIAEGVLIACCSNALGKTYNANANVKDSERTFVHKGATLVMDAGVFGKTIVFQESTAIYFEGDGAPGMGGCWVHRNGGTRTDITYWPWGVQSKAIGPAKIYIDMASGGNSSVVWRRTYADKLNICHSTDVNFCNQDVLIYGRAVGTCAGLEAAQYYGIGNLTVSNVTVYLNGNSASLTPYAWGKGTVRMTGGARFSMQKSNNLNRNENNHNFRLVIDDQEFFGLGQTVTGRTGADPWGGTTNVWWHGPVTLNGDLVIYNQARWASAVARRWQGFTLEGKVSGPGCIRPYHTGSDMMTVNLLGTENDFTGGIMLGGSTLAVWRNGAVPTQEGAGLVCLTNSHVMFGLPPTRTQWDVFSMPVTEFFGTGTVTNGTGRWKGLVKKGSGTLDYNSQLDGDYLDLDAGTVKFNTAYRSAYTEANKPDDYAAALPSFTTLKGAAGVLDVAGLATDGYTVETFVDTPSVTNADVTVKNGWTVSAAALAAGNVATFSGGLTFGSGAGVTVTDYSTLPSRAGGYVLARAKSITGFVPSYGDKWCAEIDADGKTIRIKRLGLRLIVR